MLRRPGLRLDALSNTPHLNSNRSRAGPPHGFGKHISQVSAQDFETFEVVPRNFTVAERPCRAKLTDTDTSRAITYSAISII